MQSLHFLFVYRTLRTGGIETLIVRISNWLIENGHRVTLLLEKGGELLELLNKNVRVDVLGYKYYLSFLPRLNKIYLKQYYDDQIDVIFSFRPRSCLLASVIYRNMKMKPKFITGTYHLNEYFIKGKNHVESVLHSYLLNNYISDKSKLFMSRAVRDSHEVHLRRKMPEARIWPLPIEERMFQDVVRNPRKFKIVSIGRAIDFKTYNIYMIDVIDELVREGYDVYWDVYGRGDLEQEMRMRIGERKLEDRISLKGTLPYPEMKTALSDAYLFVGMGSSALEAGFCKVPCIPAVIQSKEPMVYGYLYDLPYYTCGEFLEGVKKVKVVDLIRNLFSLSPEDYQREMDKTYSYVQAYRMNAVMREFLRIVDGTPRGQTVRPFRTGMHSLYFLYEIIYQMYICIKSKFRTCPSAQQNSFCCQEF